MQLVKREDRYDLYNDNGQKIGSTLKGAGMLLSASNCQAIENDCDLDEWNVEIVTDSIPADLAPGGWDVFPKLDKDGCVTLKKI